MRRGNAWKELRDYGQWMRMSERAVFLALLERSDNADCSIPARMTPSLAQLAEACCCAKSTAAAALDHLEWHAWLVRKRSKGGRTRKTTYQLTEGCGCRPGCPKRRSPTAAKRSDSRTVYEAKRSDARTAKRSDSHPQNHRSDAISDVGIREGKDRQGSLASPDIRFADGALPERPAWTSWPPGSNGEYENEAAEQRARSTGLSPSMSGPEGPCARCRRPCNRYGDGGRPLCDDCSEAPP